MYQIFVDSLLYPKNLLEHRNRGGWFTFFYLFLLTILVSTSTFVYVFGYSNNSEFTEEATSCSFVENKIACQSTVDQPFHLYGVSIYLLNETDSFPTTIDAEALIFQGSQMIFYTGGSSNFSLPIPQPFQGMGFDAFFASFVNGMKLSLIIQGLFSNLTFLLFIGLISSLSFIRLKAFIPYKKMFKLIIFALTPVAVLLTFYNLLNLPDVLLLLLLFLGYRSIFVLQRTLFFQTGMYLQKQGQNLPSDHPAQEEQHDESDQSEESEEQKED